MAGLTIQQAKEMLNAFSSNDMHNTKVHSFQALNIGMQIAASGSESLQCALLLHDIGYLIGNGARYVPKQHAFLGRDWLQVNGISDPEILLPIAYHENDLDLENSCSQDPMFISASEYMQKRLLEYCRIVHEADIIAHMVDLISCPEEKEEMINLDLLRCLEAEELPAYSAIRSINEQILYMLCGIVLIRRPDSIAFLRREKILQLLINKLPEELRNTVLDSMPPRYLT